jgi:linoleoyl-CoA desaturase
METQITFKKNKEDNQHYQQLRRLVKRRIQTLPKSRKQYKKIWAFAFPLIFFMVYSIALSQRQVEILYLILYMIMGIITVLIFINLIHDAVHNNIFKSRKSNQLLLYVFDVLGGNSYIWKKRHILMHHNFQNIAGWDSDIEQAGLIKIYPQDKTTKFHKHQHLLVFFFYPLFMFNWMLIRDFRDYFDKHRLVRKVCEIPNSEYLKLFFFKLLFLSYMLIVPIWLGVAIGQAVAALCLFMISGSLFAMLVLLTPHANDQSDFPSPDDKGLLPTSWFKHQFRTTNDLSASNWFTKQCMGNFNFHVVHHLFPNISSVYAPEATEVIKQYAMHHNLEYKSYGLLKSLNHHYKLIKKNAFDFDWFEEDM